MSLKQIGRRLEKLEASTGVNIPGQAEEVLRHWAETGEFGLPDGSPVPLAVFDEIMDRRVSREPPARRARLSKAPQANAPKL